MTPVNKKFYEHALIRLSMGIAEAFVFFLAYDILAKLNEMSYTNMPFLFVLVAIFLSLGNLLLKQTGHRIITFAGLNIFVMFIISYIVNKQQSNILLLICLVLMMIRVIYVSYKDHINVYSHFDFSMTLSLVFIIALDFANFGLQYGILWIILIFFFNLMPLYVSTRMQEEDSPLLSTISITISLLFAISALGYVLLPKAVGSASTAFKQIKNVSKYFFGYLEVLILKLVQRPPSLLSDPSSSGGGSQGSNGEVIPPSQGSELSDTVMKVILLMVALGIILILAILFFYAIRQLIALLFKKQAPTDFDFSIDFLGMLGQIWDRLTGFFSLLFIRNKHLSLFDTYNRFLKWGSKKGIPRFNYETPLEYSRRIVLDFDYLEEPIKEITDLFIHYRYSDQVPTSKANTQAKTLLRQLNKPKAKAKAAR